MSMKSTKYIQIDKSIIAEGMVCDFEIFTPSKCSKNMQHCIDSNTPITCIEKEVINSDKLLYVLEADYPKYNSFRENFLNTQQPVLFKDDSFERQALSIYQNASKVLSNLFDNPETLGNYQTSKEVVKNMVGIILNEKYTMKSIMSIAAHDYYTHTHSINVAIYALSLGSFLNFSSNELSELGEAALLHDLGKSKIDPAIINKKGKLTENEFEEIKKHPTFGYTIGLKLGIKNKKVLEGIRHHHEKMDGSGYPFKMKNEEIPLYSRIIGMCDIFDALTSRRSYKEPMTSFEALLLMRTTMQSHIDMNLLKKMIVMFK